MFFRQYGARRGPIQSMQKSRGKYFVRRLQTALKHVFLTGNTANMTKKVKQQKRLVAVERLAVRSAKIRLSIYKNGNIIQCIKKYTVRTQEWVFI